MAGNAVSPTLHFLPFFQKIFRQPLPETSWLNFWLRIPLWIFSLFSLVYSTFGTSSTNKFNFFHFITNIIWKTLPEIIFEIHKFLIFGNPWDPSEVRKIVHIKSVWYQNKVKRACWIHFWSNLWKILKN